MASVLAIGLSACDSSGPSSVDNTAPNAPHLTRLSTAGDGSVTVRGFAEAKSTVTVIFPDGTTKFFETDSSGEFFLTSDHSQPSGDIKITSTDADGNKSKPSIIADKDVTKSIYLATGAMPALGFLPSLGINTEAPQGGSDDAGMPMPFVDIFRTARPFKELSPQGTQFDINGWPMQNGRTKLLQGTPKDALPNGQYTFLYEGNGTVNFSSGGSLVSKSNVNSNLLLLDLQFKDNKNDIIDTNVLAFGITDISSGSYIKNIRIIMPGGTCSGNSFIHIDPATDKCPNGTIYESFARKFENGENPIIFNPDYLLFLRNFKLVRMMNLMEASPKKMCYSTEDCPVEAGTWDNRAKLSDAVWGGSDGRTAHIDHKGAPLEVIIELANVINRDIWINIPHFAKDDYIKNAALMVSDDLHNSLNIYLEYSNEVWNSGFSGGKYMSAQGRDLGLDMIPQGDDVSPSDKFTRYCDPVQFDQKTRDGRRCKNYFSRLRYFSQRSVEVFDLWQENFTDTNRFTRVLGSFVGDPLLTDLMLKHIPENSIDPIEESIDAVAIAPYFYGCPYRYAKDNFCNGEQKVLSEATSVDDIFEIIDQPALDPNDNSKYFDIKGLDGTILSVKRQLKVINTDKIKLITYEGGQHLVPGIFGDKVSYEKKETLRKLFNDANRDPRMKQRYETFLHAWKGLSDQGATLFTLYTMPQSYYRYGNFGIKEHLNKSRAESPKFDGVMSFQEAVGNCWWTGIGCN